jgi:O-methyltransferase
LRGSAPNQAGLTERESGYEPVTPYATYAPWNNDPLFLETYQAIQHNTLVDRYRCYELWTLVEQSGKLSGGLIEVGVWRGGTGALIARKARLCGIESPVYLCDTFSGVVKTSDKDTHYRGGEHADTSLPIVEKLVHDTLKLDNVRILPGIFPDQTAQMVEDSSFRFCHVDVDVYQSAKEVVDWVWGKLVIGGIVVYDDYGFNTCAGITRFVNEQRALPDRLVIHNLNGHAIVIKIA